MHDACTVSDIFPLFIVTSYLLLHAAGRGAEVQGAPGRMCGRERRRLAVGRRFRLDRDRYRTLSAIQNGIITVRTKAGCDCAAHVLSLVSSTQDISEVSQSSHGHARPSLDPRQAASPLPALQAAAPREQ